MKQKKKHTHEKKKTIKNRIVQNSSTNFYAPNTLYILSIYFTSL